jgi:hypothetical protein
MHPPNLPRHRQATPFVSSHQNLNPIHTATAKFTFPVLEAHTPLLPPDLSSERRDPQSVRSRVRVTEWDTSMAEYGQAGGDKRSVGAPSYALLDVCISCRPVRVWLPAGSPFRRLKTGVPWWHP